MLLYNQTISILKIIEQTFERDYYEEILRTPVQRDCNILCWIFVNSLKQGKNPFNLGLGLKFTFDFLFITLFSIFLILSKLAFIFFLILFIFHKWNQFSLVIDCFLFNVIIWIVKSNTCLRLSRDRVYVCIGINICGPMYMQIYCMCLSVCIYS